MESRATSSPSRLTVPAATVAFCVLLCSPPMAAQEPGRAGAVPPSPDLARVKQEEALKDLHKLEEAMDRLAALLARSEPQNAAKLAEAFRKSRQTMVREKMERILAYLKDRKLDRAIETQGEVRVNLQEILDILLEKDMDPRELLKHLRRLRDILERLDAVVREETAEKLASDEAEQAGAESQALAEDLALLEGLIREEKALEQESRDPARLADGKLPELAPRQKAVREATEALRKKERERQERREAEAARQKSPPGGGRPGEHDHDHDHDHDHEHDHDHDHDHEREAGHERPRGEEPGRGDAREGDGAPLEPGAVLDGEKLAEAAAAMEGAEAALSSGAAGAAQRQTTAARAALEEAIGRAEERLQRLRLRRDFAKMKAEQDATREKTDDLAARMAEPPPLVATPEGDVPGREEVAQASGEMRDASQELGQGRPGRASRSQARALDRLNRGRERTEEALEQLQQAFRERLLAYLREKFGYMLAEQRSITQATRSLDLKLKALRLRGSELGSPGSGSAPEIERRDRQLAESLSAREGELMAVSEDILDLLQEDGTTLVFPQVVGEIRADLENVKGLLSRIETGELTQSIQRDIEKAIEEILAALEEAYKKPPPPNPNQGREGQSGTSPLLARSSELKMVRALQLRVNQRTRDFDLGRDPSGEAVEELSPAKKLQVDEIARKQKQVEEILRQIAAGSR
jgi:hypothetical protein